MPKDELKKEKKSKRKSEVVAMEVDGDVSVATAVAASPEKKDKKDKKAKKEDKEEKKDKKDEEIPAEAISAIAKPLASKDLSKQVFKTIKKATKSRGHVKRGVKEVVKALRKSEKGLVVLAGDISPVDVLSHIPILCEDTSNPYIFVTSKDALGAAGATKRPTSCVMIVPGGGKKAAAKGKDATKQKEEYQPEYEKLHKEIQALSDSVAMA